MSNYNINDRMPSSGRVLKEDSSYINIADLIEAITSVNSINIAGADGAAVDAFQRIRVSSPTAIFDNAFQYDDNPLVWVRKIIGTGTVTHSPLNSSVLLTVSGNAGDTTIYQTKSYIRYQPGRSQLIMLTYGNPPTTERFRCGYFDAFNGIYFQLLDGVAAFAIRSNVTGNVVENEVAHNEWNLDPLDGTGSSGVTLDTSKAQIIVIDLEWLSLGRVRVGFNIGGQTIYVHEFTHANKVLAPYMQTANLPMRYELTNVDGQASGESVLAICGVVFSEGGDSEERGLGFSVSNSVARGYGTAFQPVISIRPKATYNSVINRAGIFPEQISALAINNITEIAVFYNASLTNASWLSANQNSLVEYDQSAVTLSGGNKIISFFVAAGGAGANAYSTTGQNGLLGKYPLGLDVDGANPDTITLAARAITAPASALGSFQWKEVR